MTKPAPTPRAAAIHLLTQVTEHGRLLTELLPGAVAHLQPGDRARAQRLATTTLRWADRADRMLGPYLRNRPEDVVLNALRLGVVEMAELGGEPHGVVGEIVGITKKTANLSKSKLVNAVLRNITMDLEKWQTLPVPQLPKWLRKRLRETYGKPGLLGIEAAHATEPPLDVNVKSADAGEHPAGQTLPTGSIRLTGSPQVSKLPGFEAGDWWIQDAAATLPARILAPQQGEPVLDLCAAPGGKTMQLAAAGGHVTALDDSESRMHRLRENLARTGLNAEIVVADALEWLPKSSFTAILLDAPCSATGTIRRHPDLPYAKSMADIEPLFDVQAKLLDRAIGFLKPGGRLVYCTCSLLPEEGEDQIAALLNRNKDVSVNKSALDIPGIDPDWITEHGLRTRPDYWADIGGMDGFFICCLQKHA